MDNNPHLIFGKAYHAAMEHGVHAGIKMLHDASMYSSVSLLQEMKDRVDTLMESHGIVVIEKEVKIDKEYANCNERYIGYIDGLCTMNGKNYLLEYKTAREIDIDFTRIDSQALFYLAHYDAKPVDGMIYIINKKASSTEIPRLQNGHLSVAKSIPMQYDAYERAIIETYNTIEEAPQKVQEHLDWLKDNESPNIAIVIINKDEKKLSRTREYCEDLTRYVNDINARVDELGFDEFMESTQTIVSKFKCGSCKWKERCLTFQ